MHCTVDTNLVLQCTVGTDPDIWCSVGNDTNPSHPYITSNNQHTPVQYIPQMITTHPHIIHTVINHSYTVHPTYMITMDLYNIWIIYTVDTVLRKYTCMMYVCVCVYLYCNIIKNNTIIMCSYITCTYLTWSPRF